LVAVWAREHADGAGLAAQSSLRGAAATSRLKTGAVMPTMTNSEVVISTTRVAVTWKRRAAVE
jgi:hypothetical protein